MDKLQFRTLESKEELEQFVGKVENYTNVRLPWDYVQRSQVVGVFSQGKLSAGYMLVTQPDFRSLLFVPDQVKKENSFFEKDRYEMMEVNGLWVGPSIRNPKYRTQIWFRLVMDIFKCRKKYLLLMSNSKNRTIRDLHNLSNPTDIYTGAPHVMAGHKTHSSVRVAYTTRWRMMTNFLKLPIAMKSREKRMGPVFKQRHLMRT